MATIVKKTEGTVDVQAELEWLFYQQKARLNEMLEVKVQVAFDPKLTKQIGREIRLFADLLQRLTEYYFADGHNDAPPKKEHLN